MPKKGPVLVPRHNPFVGIEPDASGLVLYAVRRGQARLGGDPVVRQIREYADRKSWYETAEELARHYFPRSFRDQNTRLTEAVTWLYLYALLLYPRQYRLKGTYRPDWTRGTLLSWFRRSVGPATRQWWGTRITLDEASAIEQSVENARTLLRILDVEWLRETMTFLDDQSQEEGLRGELARLIYLPVALAHLDGAWKARTQFDALPHKRKLLRAQKIGTVGYMRRGREVWLVADRYARQKLAELDWTDLREGSLEVRDYRVSWTENKNGQGVSIELRPEVMDTLAAQVKVILNGDGTAPYKLHRLNQTLEDFAHLHQHATGAARQLWTLDRWIYQRVRQTLMPHYPEAGKRLTWLKGKLYTALVLPIPNLFLDLAQASENTWRAMFSPYR